MDDFGGDIGARQMMSHAEVETLFHEFGHALQSLLSRTEFQHLSGEATCLYCFGEQAQLTSSLGIVVSLRALLWLEARFAGGHACMCGHVSVLFFIGRG